MTVSHLEADDFAPGAKAGRANNERRTVVVSPFPGIIATYEETAAEPASWSDLLALGIACLLACTLIYSVIFPS